MKTEGGLLGNSVLCSGWRWVRVAVDKPSDEPLRKGRNPKNLAFHFKLLYIPPWIPTSIIRNLFWLNVSAEIVYYRSSAAVMTRALPLVGPTPYVGTCLSERDGHIVTSLALLVSHLKSPRWPIPLVPPSSSCSRWPSLYTTVSSERTKSLCPSTLPSKNHISPLLPSTPSISLVPSMLLAANSPLLESRSPPWAVFMPPK